MYRATGSWNRIVEDPGETELANPGYLADKTFHYCKERGCLNNHCPKLARKQSSGKKCEYPGCTTPAGHSADKCWEDPENKEDRPANWISRTKKNLNEASTDKMFL